MLAWLWKKKKKKGNPPELLVGMQACTTTYRTVWRYLRKLYVELPHDPAIPLLRLYPDKTCLEKDTGTRMFIAAPNTTARTWKQPKCPRQMNGLRRCGTDTQWNTTQP